MTFEAKMKKTLEKWGLKAVDSLAKSLKDKGVVFAGGQESELIGSAEIKTRVLGVDIFMNDYWLYVDQGRKPGPVSEEGRQKIKRWVQRKGLVKTSVKGGFFKEVESISYVIARKISKKGYKGKFFVEAAITEKLMNELAQNVADVVEEFLTDELNDNNT